MAALIVTSLLLSCAAKKTVVQPPPSPIDETAFQEHLARGDDFFAESHLYGWRRAEAGDFSTSSRRKGIQT